MTEPQRYRYDVFISYSQDDREWVWGWLLPRLEAAGLSVCLDESCFEPGAPRAEETERVVRESRRSLVVLSPAVVASQWDQFEALLVHAQDPAASGRRLIPLLLRPCDPPERIKLLQWVDFSDPERQEAQLRRVIDAIQGKTTLPELRPEAAFPSPTQRRWELRWYAVAGVAAVLTLIMVMASVLSQTEPRKMPEGHFNIAVAEFVAEDINGHEVRNRDLRELSSSIGNYLLTAKDELTEIKADPVEVWGPRKVGRVSLNESEDRAEKLRADVIVYGQLSERDDGAWDVEPAFLLSDQTFKEIAQAEELVGPYALGTPLRYRPGSEASIKDVNTSLKARVKALTQLLIGLSYFAWGSEDGFEKATVEFEQAAQDPGWGASEDYSGQDILFLFLGNAYIQQHFYAESRGADLEERRVILENAQQALEHAHDLNQGYARTYSSLGNVSLQLGRLSNHSLGCPSEWTYPKQAEEWYTKALNAPDTPQSKPVSADIDFKAHLGLGRVNYLEGICKDPSRIDFSLFAEARHHYKAAIDSYENEPLTRRRFTAFLAYADHGNTFYFEHLFRKYDAGVSDAHLLTRAVENYNAAYGIVQQLQSEYELQAGLLFMPYYVLALCETNEAKHANTVLDEFSARYPQSGSVRAAIVKQTAGNMPEGCINETPQ